VSERIRLRRSIERREPTCPHVGVALFVEPQGGRVFELTHDARPEIVWEYVNDLGDGDAGYIFDAQRVPSAALTFLDRPCP